MNCKQANDLPIQDVVESFTGIREGIQKAHIVWYRSPFRDEKKPSFRVDLRSNRWKDFGKPGKNEGSVVDFIIEFKNCNIETALSLIEDFTRSTRGQIKASFSSFQEQNAFQNLQKSENSIDKLGENKNDLSDNLEIISVKPLANKALVDYVLERKVNLDIAKKYLKEIYFKNNKANKSFFAVAFQNDCGAYEYRNKYLGGVIGHKDITTIGEIRSEIALFEGFFDFLSYLSDKGEKSPHEAYIVLNSVNLIDKAVAKLDSTKIQRVFSFLDNDNAGDVTTEILIDKLKDKVNDKRSLYSEFKDYNDYLQNNVKL